MAWLRRNWAFLVCGAVVVLALAVMGWALYGFSKVKAEARQAAALADQIRGAMSNPVNEEVIREEAKRIQEIQQDIKQSLQIAYTINRRKPLLEGVFPEPKSADMPYKFRAEYRLAIQQLLARLNAKDAPTGDLVQRIATQFEEKQQKKAALFSTSGKYRIIRPPQVTLRVSVARAPGGPGMMPGVVGGGVGDRFGGGRGDRFGAMDRGGDRGGEYTGPTPRTVRPATPRSALPLARTTPRPVTPMSVIDRQEILKRATAYAIYKRAKSIWTYASQDSFTIHPLVDAVERPTPLQMWAAQVGLWIQQDIVEALRRVNERVANRLPEDQKWVAYLPVKHLVRIDIGDYITQTQSGAGAFGERGGRSVSVQILRDFQGLSGAYFRGGSSSYLLTGQSVFTGRSCNDLYDVVRFSLEMVLDIRDVPTVLNEICKQNFFTPLLVRYRAVDAKAAREAGYLYGAEPVVEVYVLMEALFFKQVYADLMPKEVQDRISGKAMQGPGGRFGRF